ncbi:hypothetical protein ACSNOH_29235 [Streptomyces sp. URMC 127]|uniref:hypothetical protein n=1 Tax=Streptomyces sp. URMC 127 TaxID=3423402 RepID=UPI003F1D19F6
MHDFTGAEAALGRVADVEKAARARSGWYARYLWVFAAGQLILVPIAVLWHGFVPALVFVIVNAALVTGLSLYAARQRVVRRGFGAKHGLIVGTWGAVFALAASLGNTVFVNSPAFAAAATTACALPLAMGAWLEMWRSS